MENLIDNTGIRINGSNPWDIEVNDERLFDRVLQHKNLGLGEAYMDGWWECRQLDEFICRILKSDLDITLRDSLPLLIPFLMALVLNRQSKTRSRIIAERHYDPGNDLFMAFLDPYMQYSCAYFDDTDDLARAQRNKLDLICRKLHLQPHDRVLDIECGWGGFAKYAALHDGCDVTAVNISDEQMRVAREFCKGLPIEIIATDYRELRGTYDKIVSVGMFEHVGYKNYRTFMEAARRCLKDGGIFLLHTIGGNASHIKCDPWINAYIFPNAMIPSIAQIGQALEGLFVMEDWHNLSPHYD